jgi:diguanylate cyclase (GGDEF)-like protein/PAS domain S-box-containing protein
MTVDTSFFRSLLEQLSDGVYIVDRDRKISLWNRAAEQLTGYSAEEIIGTCCAQSILRHVDHGGRTACAAGCPLSDCLNSVEPEPREMYLRHKDGHRVPVSIRVVPITAPDGAVVGAAEVFTDNTTKGQLRQRLLELERLALLDPLTALPNRRFLEAQLGNRLDELKRYQWPCGVVYLDVDRFKDVNDGHGHAVGDEVLKMVGKTLTASSRIFDAVGRWGGDEFMAVMANVQRRELVEVAERFRALVGSACLEAPQRLQVTVSVGLAMATPEDTLSSLVERADKMLYEAKRAGRNRVCI